MRERVPCARGGLLPGSLRGRRRQRGRSGIERAQRAPRRSIGLLLTTASLAVSGCLIEDHKCGKNQRVSVGALLSCQCEPGFVLAPEGYDCVSCPENSTASASGACVCNPGFGRQGPGDPCLPVEGSFAGAPCSETDPCSPPAGECATAESEPYCTTECTRPAECPENWRCRPSGGRSLCVKPPTGLGEACTSSADCAGKEAGYCEVVAAHACLPNECLRDLSVCPSGFSCCDLTSYLGTSLCVVESFLTGGLCPGGSPPVTQVTQ